MQERSITRTLQFRHPFKIPGLDEVQPSGDYLVDIDEELLEGLSFMAYRRTSARLHLPEVGARTATTHVVALSPTELDTLTARDAAS